MQQLPKLSSKILEELQKGKNLLAFSAGSDSSALFFILEAFHVNFDIALVNYQTREQSFEEENHARDLAKQFGKECFVLQCKLETNNFEHKARQTRYDFFQNIINKHSYTTLLSAHHLNDKLEWFLMQLSRGAGCVELSGMSEIEDHETYKTIRPLLSISKNEITNFLHVNKIKHFIDSSNKEQKHFRNQIREEFANSFCDKYASGIKKSFAYLSEDSQRLLPKDIKQKEKLYILQQDKDDLINIRGIDKIAKKLGVLLSHSTREEILRTKDCIISSQIAVCFSDDKIYIAPAIHVVMDKKFKEKCRVEKIPPKIRPYLSTIS